MHKEHPLRQKRRTIKSRCNNPKDPAYPRYGGRGITFCKEWMDSYESFYNWALANGYQDGLEIDRINNDGNYEPSNCRFVTAKENCRNKSSNRFITAFGETKTLAAWVEDSRIVVTYATLSSRLKSGWDVDKAMTTPTGRTIFAFGELKSIDMWVLDPRCVIKDREKLRARLNRGWSPEESLTQIDKKEFKNTAQITAFGETKSATKWAKDKRAAVSRQQIWARIQYYNWSPEDAISTPISKKYKAFGESKTIKEWVLDSRCMVNETTLRHRLLEGEQLEFALREVKQLIAITAFGETKPILEWAADKRCVVSITTLRGRLAKGWLNEEAIAKHSEEMITAFGETKEISSWLIDDRMKVNTRQFRKRIKIGWSIEKAISTPVLQSGWSTKKKQ